MSASAKRNARIELTASSAGVDRGLSETRRKMRQFQRDQAREAKAAERAAEKARKRFLGGARNVAGGVKDGMLTGLGMDAAGGLQSFATDILDYEKKLTRLQITADKSPETMRAFSDSVMRASNATGIARTEILDAAAAYVALTGDMDTARGSTETWAKISAATGTKVDDIAKAAAALSQQMGITSPQMEAVFSGLAAQGKAGAIELKDLGGELAQIAPQWAMFKDGKGAAGVAKLGAALQIVKRGFGGDAGETVTGLQSLLISLVQHAGDFEAAGVKVFDVDKTGKKTMKDVFTIVENISKSKLVKDPEAMKKAFGRVEAFRAYLQLSQNKQALEDIVRVGGNASVIQRDFDTYMQSSAGKMEGAWTRIKNAIAEALTPERIAGFASALEGIAGKLEPIVAGFGKIGAALGGLYGVGQSVRGALRGETSVLGDRLDDVADYRTIESGGRGFTKDGGFSTEASPDQVLAAQLRIKNREGYRAARDEIMGAELDEKTSPESIRRAFAAKYGDNTGSQLAGGSYLKAAGVRDPVEAARAGMDQVSAVVREQKLAAAVKEGIKEGFAGLGIKIGAEPIQKGAANSINHRRGH